MLHVDLSNFSDELLNAIFGTCPDELLELTKGVPAGYELCIDKPQSFVMENYEDSHRVRVNGTFREFPSCQPIDQFVAAVAKPCHATLYHIGVSLPDALWDESPSGTGYGDTAAEAALAAFRNLHSKLPA